MLVDEDDVSRSLWLSVSIMLMRVSSLSVTLHSSFTAPTFSMKIRSWTDHTTNFLFKPRSLEKEITHTKTHTHARLTALCPGLPGSAGTRKVKSIWILLKQQTVSGSGISWAICKSALRSRQIATPAPYHSTFYRPDALPATQPTSSKH